MLKLFGIGLGVELPSVVAAEGCHARGWKSGGVWESDELPFVEQWLGCRKGGRQCDGVGMAICWGGVLV